MLVPLLLASRSPPPPVGAPTTPVLAALSPLIGAPAFLRLHIKVKHDSTVYDFVPLKPRSASTLRTLLTGGAVDGEIRVLPARESPAEEEWRVVGHTALSAEAFQARVRERAEQPQQQQLSLLGNNCWSFAANVLAAASPDCAEG